MNKSYWDYVYCYPNSIVLENKLNIRDQYGCIAFTVIEEQLKLIKNSKISFVSKKWKDSFVITASVRSEEIVRSIFQSPPGKKRGAR